MNSLHKCTGLTERRESFPRVSGVGNPNPPRHAGAPNPKANILKPTKIRIVHMTAGQTLKTAPCLSDVRMRMSVPTATLTRVRRGLPCAAIDFWNLTSVQVNTNPFAVLTGEAQVFALLPLPGSLWSLLVLTSCRWFSGLQARPRSQDPLFYGLPTDWLLFNV